MTCALCQKNEANKTNTHYLTDAIIKRCLNEDGGIGREKGLYFDISSDKIFTAFNFQRETSVAQVEKTLGRDITQGDIDKAYQNPFSVNNVFCDECEDRFTEIEKRFDTKYSRIFRNMDNCSESHLFCDDSITFRLFFLLQVLRTSICESRFKLKPEIEEKLRQLILQPNEEGLKEFPLAIAYMTIKGEEIEFTNGMVGYITGANPSVIFMCNFIVQFYDSYDKILFLQLNGVNQNNNYKEFINFKEKEFITQIISNEKRIEIIGNYQAEKAKRDLDKYTTGFIKFFCKKYGKKPSQELVVKYRKGLTNWEHIPIVERQSLKRIVEFTFGFINNNQP